MQWVWSLVSYSMCCTCRNNNSASSVATLWQWAGWLGLGWLTLACQAEAIRGGKGGAGAPWSTGSKWFMQALTVQEGSMQYFMHDYIVSQASRITSHIWPKPFGFLSISAKWYTILIKFSCAFIAFLSQIEQYDMLSLILFSSLQDFKNYLQDEVFSA